MKISRSLVTAIVAGVLVLLIGSGWYFGVYAPVMSKIAATRAQVNTENGQLATDRAEMIQLVSDKRNAGALRRELLALTNALPSTFSLAAFIRQADATAAAAGVPLLQITPTQPGAPTSATSESSSVPGVSSIAFTASASGTFDAILHFLHGLDHVGELVNVQTMQLSADSGGGRNPKISLSFTGAVYYRG